MTFSNENNKSAFSEGEKTTFKNEPENTLTYTVSKNVETVVINITEDKLKNYLRDYSDISTYSGLALGFSGIAMTLIITITTVSEYKEKFNIKPAVWEAIFLLSTLIVIASAIYFIAKWWRCKNELKVEELIKKIKGL